MAFAVGAYAPAYADDSAPAETKVKIEDVKEKNAPSSDDADSLITNNKLRAETGSKSKLSIATSLAYNGATVNSPGSDYRPNIFAGNGATNVSDIEGGINIKYNITKRDSLLLGETIRFVTPFSSLSKTPAGYAGQKTDSYDPGLTYQRIYNVGGLQSYYQVGPNVVTRSNLTKIGYLGNVQLYNVNAIEIGTSRVTVGLETGTTYAWFRDPSAHPDANLATADDTRDASSDWDLFADPYVEYQINDKLNLRTVMMYFQVEHTLLHTGDYNRWLVDKAVQSVGVGISVTRDIFLYPNVQFYPDQTRAKDTNVALSTNINLF